MLTCQMGLPMDGQLLLETWAGETLNPRLYEPLNFVGPGTQGMRWMVWSLLGALGLESEDWSPGPEVACSVTSEKSYNPSEAPFPHL